MWDDHEVRDNWYHAQILGPQAPHQEKRVAVLAEPARQAFLEHYPIAVESGATPRIYRAIPFGPLVDVFALDMRSYRGANSPNRQTTLAPSAAIFGPSQLAWLKKSLTS